jgi:hypothetical protein
VTLAETQALFHRALHEPEAARPEEIDACFVGTPLFDGAARLAIYQDMYLARLTDALRQTFPAVARSLGEETFAALARDYLRQHPSEHHDIAQAGRRLAAFLRRYPDPGRPGLADLTELEWARQEVFFEAPAAPVGRAALAGLSPDAFGAARLRLVPALRLLLLDHPVTASWRCLQVGQPAIPQAPGPEAVAVWRAGPQVVHAAVPLDEAAALQAARAGRPLAEVCQAFQDRDEPARSAHAALASWLEEGWLAGVEAAPEVGS